MFNWSKRKREIRDAGVKQVIVVRSDLKLGKGKLAGQVAHAAVAGFRKVKERAPEVAERWESEGEKKVVVRVEGEKELLQLFERAKAEMPCALIQDAGLTQIPAGTVTCFAIGPWYEGEIDKFTKDLKLV